VAAPKNVQHRLRKNGFNEDFQRASADQSVVVVGFVVEAERHFARGFGLHYFLRRRPDFGFDAPSANGSRDRAILTHQHARTLIARNRAIGVDDSRQRPALSFTAELDHFFKEIHREASGNQAWALHVTHVTQE